MSDNTEPPTGEENEEEIRANAPPAWFKSGMWKDCPICGLKRTEIINPEIMNEETQWLVAAGVSVSRERDKFCTALQSIAIIADNECRNAPEPFAHEVYDLARSALNVHPDFLPALTPLPMPELQGPGPAPKPEGVPSLLDAAQAVVKEWEYGHKVASMDELITAICFHPRDN